MNANQAVFWLIALPLVASPVIYLVGRASTVVSRWLAFVVLLATGYPLYVVGSQFLAAGTLEPAITGFPLRFDGISLLVATVVLTLGALVTLFSTTYMAGETGEEKFYALLTAMIGSIIGLGMAGDLFNLWVWFEAMAITSYMLVAFYRDEAASLEAGVKYLVQSAAGSVLVLIGIALVFAATGKLDLIQIQQSVQAAPSLLLAGAGGLFLIGFGVKSALVPLHTWLPDAHSQAPSGISAMLSGIVIEAGLIAMLRALGSVGAASHMWGPLILAFGALNMLLGNLMALRQSQVKRLLAYSSITNVGYILFGIGITVTFNFSQGAAGGFFHLFNHALMKGLAFLAAGSLLYALHLASHDHSPLLVTDLDGAARHYPITAFAFSLALLALGGLPPLAGFMSKWQIMVAGSRAQDAIIWILIIYTAINSVLSLGYYAPLVNRMYRHQPSPVVLAGQPISVAMALPMALMVIAITLIGLWPALVTWLTGPAANSLMSVFGGL